MTASYNSIRTCRVCQISKTITEFGRRERYKYGFATACKKCERHRRTMWKIGNPDAVRRANSSPSAKARLRRFYDRNDKREYERKLYARNSIRILSNEKDRRREKRNAIKAAFVGPQIPRRILRARRRIAWKLAHPEVAAEATARRGARKIKAAVKWANKFFILEAYRLAALRTKLTGIRWHVDHYYPLQHDLVCGLHVEQNLRVIPASVNLKKNNKMPTEFHWLGLEQTEGRYSTESRFK